MANRDIFDFFLSSKNDLKMGKKWSFWAQKGVKSHVKNSFSVK